MKTPQQILDQSREEFEKLFNNWRPPKPNEILSWHTSTLQAFIEAEIERLEGIVNYWEKDGQSFTKGVLSDLSDQISHLKELLKR